jgi:SpoIID/LytB domain protein
LRKRTLAATIVFAIVVTLTAIAVLARERQHAAALVTGFIETLAEDDTQAAHGYLAGNALQQSDVVQSLAILAQDPVLRLGTPVRAGWFGFLIRREVEAPVSAPGGPLRVRLRVRRTAGGWAIDRLPDLLAHPAAVVVRDAATAAAGQARVLIRGRDLQVSGLAPGEAGYQVGLAMVLDGRLAAFEPGEAPRTVSKLLRFAPGGPVETETEGLLPVGAGFAVYDLAGAPSFLPRLIVGSTGLQTYSWQGKVFAIAQTEPYPADRIRVAINTSGFSGLEHSQVRASCNGPMRIYDRVAGKSVSIRAGGVVVLRRSGTAVLAETTVGTLLLRGELRVHVVPAAGERVTVTSIARGPSGAEFTPSYRGYLEAAPAAGQGLNVINDLPLNEYLYSVVPSEMPVSFGLEALKVQAAAARAYAVASILGGGYGSYGAHLDDSVSSQVYNNVAEVPVSNQAVDETRLEFPVYEGSVVDARFFSTSCGFTANAHEVWSKDGQFPGPVIPYLRAVPQTSAVQSIPDEAAMAAFLMKAGTELDAPDASAPFFRWGLTMTREECEASIRANLRSRYDAQPQFVLTMDARGNFVSQPVPSGDPIGKLRDIRVVSRGEGGNIMALEIAGSAGTYRIIKEYNIRFTLRPVQYVPGRGPVVLRLQDGGTRNNYSILPSAFAVFELDRNLAGDITGVRITGGGNGHGAGMSQMGAYGLAQQGWNYRDIIRRYYPGAEIADLSGGAVISLRAEP